MTHSTAEGGAPGLGKKGTDEQKCEDVGEAHYEYVEIIKHIYFQFNNFPGKVVPKDRNLLAVYWLTFPVVMTLSGRRAAFYPAYTS